MSSGLAVEMEELGGLNGTVVMFVVMVVEDIVGSVRRDSELF